MADETQPEPEQPEVTDEGAQRLLDALFGGGDEPEREPITASNFANMTPELVMRWNALIDGFNRLLDEQFPNRGDGEEQERPIFVLGAQFGEMGNDPNLPVCVVTANLPVCVWEQACADMVDVASALHREHHESMGNSDPNMAGQEVPPGVVPQHIREEAEAFAEANGLPPEAVVYVEYADIEDLNKIPETDEPERGGEA